MEADDVVSSYGRREDKGSSSDVVSLHKDLLWWICYLSKRTQI